MATVIAQDNAIFFTRIEELFFVKAINIGITPIGLIIDNRVIKIFIKYSVSIF